VNPSCGREECNPSNETASSDAQWEAFDFEIIENFKSIHEELTKLRLVHNRDRVLRVVVLGGKI
jgi:hypothetical protein